MPSTGRILEIAIMALLFLGALLAILSTTTTHWQTVNTEKRDPKAMWVDATSTWVGKVQYKSRHMGLFKACVTESERTGKDARIYGLEKCICTVSFSTMSSLNDCNYDTVRAMMILAVIFLSYAIYSIFSNDQRDNSIQIMFNETIAAIFCITAVAIYKKFLLYQIPENGEAPEGWEKSPFGPKLGWSFYLACVAPALLLTSSVLIAVYQKYFSVQIHERRVLFWNQTITAKTVV